MQAMPSAGVPMVTPTQAALAVSAIIKAYKLVKKYQQTTKKRRSKGTKGDPNKKYGDS